MHGGDRIEKDFDSHPAGVAIFTIAFTRPALAADTANQNF